VIPPHDSGQPTPPPARVMPPDPGPSPGDRFARVALPLVLLGALALRLVHLGARSLWTDEGSTWTAATATFHALIQRCLERDASPPLYYLLTSLALRFGDGEAQLRAVSLVASAVLVWLTYRLARLAAGRAEATLAALVIALSPYQLMYAQEARTYTLVAALAVAGLYSFARAVLFGRPRAWLPYVLFSTLALYTQSLALLAVGVQVALVLLVPAARRRVVPFLLAQAVIVALYLPWLVLSFAQAEHLRDSHWYLSTPDGHGIFQVLRSVFLSPIPIVTAPHLAPRPGLDAWLPRRFAQALLVLVPTVPLVVGMLEMRAPGRRGMLMQLATAGLFLPLLAVLVAAWRVPFWLPRYFVLLTPWLAVLLACGLFRLRPRFLALGVGVLLVVVSLYTDWRYDTDYTKEPWREVAAHIAAISPPGHTVVLVPFDVDPYAYYNRHTRDRIATAEVSHPDVPFASRFTPLQLDEAEAATRATAGDYEDVWVVVRSANSEVRRELARRALRVAAEGRAQLGGEEVWDSSAGPLRVSHFRRGS
jgi:Dolichyl-phosphate-mannose-protein mannosyltransferase